MTQSRREMMFGAIGLAIIVVVAFVLFKQAAGEAGPAQSAAAPASTETGASTLAESPIPTPTATPDATPTPTPNPQTYTVQNGDTLLLIAQRFNITVDDLVAKNELIDPNDIFVGQQLVLPQPGERVAPGATPPTDEAIYVVKPGDTLYSISQLLDVTVEDLAELNEITDPTQLYVGRRLQVPERRILTPPPAIATPA